MPPRHQGAGSGLGLFQRVISRIQLWALLALTLMWGVNWPVMKLSLQGLTPLYLRAITMSLGTAFLFTYVALRCERM